MRLCKPATRVQATRVIAKVIARAMTYLNFEVKILTIVIDVCGIYCVVPSHLTVRPVSMF